MAESRCPHVITIGECTPDDVVKQQRKRACDACPARGPNLWLCLSRECLFVGCGESAADHSSAHHQKEGHALTLNLASLRVWCYVCECEVFLESNTPPVQPSSRQPQEAANFNVKHYADQALSHGDDSESEDYDHDENIKPRGLVGLQNIGNTCYMNAALQALSNCQPLTRFFVDCESYVRSETKPALSKSYQKLIAELWHRRRPSYVVPSSISYGIKIVHPMFKGYTQQDTQEFLRCLMDQMHEELKEPCLQPATVHHEQTPKLQAQDVYGMLRSSDSSLSSQSEPDYETCDSGVEVTSSSSGGAPLTRAPPTEEGEPIDVAEKDAVEMTEKDSGIQIGGGDAKVEDAVSDGEPAIRQEGEDAERGSRSSAGEDVGRVKESKEPGENRESAGEDECRKERKDTANKRSRTAAGEGRRSCDSSPVSRDSSPVLSYHSADTLEFSDAHTDILPAAQHCSPKDVKVPSCCVGRKLSPDSSTGPVTKSPRIRNLSHPGKQTQSCSAEASANTSLLGKKKQVSYHSVISDIFDGQLLSSVKCLTCNRISMTRETFQDLSLPIPTKEHIHMMRANITTPGVKGVVPCGDSYTNQGWLSWAVGWLKSWFWGPTIKLHDCLSAFFSDDELKGDNMYSCEKCKKLRNGVKYSKVLALPEILCIHLKRFRHETMFSSKINTYISFPLTGLDMSDFLHKDECTAQVTTYDLVAVICHHGTAGGGHYTAYALNHISDQWYEYDDQYVTEVNEQTVENCEAYVLFYRKSNNEMLKLRQQAEDLQRSRETSLMNFYISKQWINKFNTFAEPGPITSYDFLCAHGGVAPHKFNHVRDLCLLVPQPVWEYLHKMFGGGPVCNRLYLCTVCHRQQEVMETKRRQELNTFVRLHKEFQAKSANCTIYALSLSWFKEWENFVKCRSDEPAGAVENSSIAVQQDGRYVVKSDSDYGQISEEMWHFFFGIYGGGPEILLQQGPPCKKECVEENPVTRC
ncbi:PREDICTED: ubiquitin carboxyl-terminal hydrolase 33-like isoform X2 [Priapulus caudatus]|uniref:Ubiquitin carboxyl-terminal hydrolase n=1 Tax=Priapulus caudatus TaxID=37621 RepID=A0ABM1EP25_PRICU|nr:PREDICTED: ubiquitin carboxyl-terminal hydrolase 33-like isoform X2 [Priapulus caudatus]